METIKETRVFICDISEFEEYSNKSISADIIAEIQKSQELKESFISLAEKTGKVYSLKGFQNAVNNEEVNTPQSYILITNEY
jgi:predicted AAA+ superfamily ATPase